MDEYSRTTGLMATAFIGSMAVLDAVIFAGTRAPEVSLGLLTAAMLAHLHYAHLYYRLATSGRHPRRTDRANNALRLTALGITAVLWFAVPFPLAARVPFAMVTFLSYSCLTPLAYLALPGASPGRTS